MSKEEEVVGFLNDMLDALTWKRFFLLAFLTCLMLGLLVVFEGRNTIFNKVFGQVPTSDLTTPWAVSAESKAELNGLTKHPYIAAVLLTEVNLKKNRRITKYWYSRDEEFREEATKIMATLLPQAFFDTSKNNNDQMLAVLSNQFVCSNTVDTVFVNFFPNIQKKFPTICRLAVPPFTGEFAGMVTILLDKTPSPSQMDALKIELTRVSVELYLRDIQHGRTP